MNPLTRLAKAVLHDQKENVQHYLSQGDSADVRVTPEGLTGLMFSSYWGNLEVVKLLISYGANLNATLEDGTTALMKAVQQNRIPVVIELLNAGAEVGLKDNRGWDALKFAEVKGLSEIMLLLNEAAPSLENERQLTEFLFGGVKYQEIDSFCKNNFSNDFYKNLLLLLFSEIIFGDSDHNKQLSYTVDICLLQWDPDQTRFEEQLSLETMRFVGVTNERFEEIRQNKFRLSKYGRVFFSLVESWLNTSISNGRGKFCINYEQEAAVWLSYCICKADLKTLDMFPREKRPQTE